MLPTSTYLSASSVNSTGMKGSWMNTSAFTFVIPTLIFSWRRATMNNWRVSLESAVIIIQTIWLSLKKVSVVSLCGNGTTAVSLSTVKSRGCIVRESAVYRFMGRVLDCPLLSCFALFSGGHSDHTLLSLSSLCHSPAFQIVCVPLEGITWVNHCNMWWWWKPVGNRTWEMWSKQIRKHCLFNRSYLA